MITYKEKPDTDESILNILNPIVKKWFRERFGEFGPPQRYAVLDIHSRKNVLVSAPTGSGKTLTAFLSILNELIDTAQKGMLEDKIYCVYLSPLKALNYDIEVNLRRPLKEIEDLAGKKLGIRIGVRTGDTTAKEKSEMRERPPHILITTPESLAIILNSPRFVENMNGVQWIVVDELHALAENKRGVHLSLTLERLHQLNSHAARIGLSATIAPLEEIAQFLVGFEKSKGRDCTIVDVQFLKGMDMKVISPVNDFINTAYEEVSDALYKKLHELIQEHKTTLIFTNTRSATERVVHNLKQKFSEHYDENIGAHHSSLGKATRKEIENSLREGSLKVVVCSTSLELGIDIGYIGLVICLSSPKSVARFLQRAGRAGHKLHSTIKARIMVMDRDDLVECALILKSAIGKKIDRLHIPRNCLDVLAQHIYGIAIHNQISLADLFKLIKQSYCYASLDYSDFEEVIKYLAGEYASLEDRHVYGKVWWDRESNIIGKKGRLARVIYMTNIGTIPDESFINVKPHGGKESLGKIDEAFVERLKPGDVFVLGGKTYEFRYSRDMTAFVNPNVHRSPNVPSWVSEMLPLSFDLGVGIGKFRRLLSQKFSQGTGKHEIMAFIHEYLYIDALAAESIYRYFWEQFHFAVVPSDKQLVIEHYYDGEQKYAIFHSVYGRRVNDCLSRAVAFAIGKQQGRDVEVGVTDNGFYVTYKSNVNVLRAFKVLKPDQLRGILEQAIDKSEVLRRRFRHCACRSLMILREYKGRRKMVGRQQISSRILLSAVKRLNPNFPILKEARREVLEDLMDIQNAQLVLEKIESGEIEVKEIFTHIASPFAFDLVTQGYSDIIKIEDKYEFLQRMHQMVLAKIGKNIDEKNKEQLLV